MAVFISMWFLGVFLPFKSEPQRVYWSQWLVINLHMYMELLRIVLFNNRKRLPKLLACLHVSMWLHHWWISWWTTILNRSQWGHCNNSTLTWFSVNVSHHCLQNLLSKASLEIHVWSLGIPEMMWKYDKYTCTMIR